MKLAHSIQLRVFVNPEEDESLIRTALIKLLSIDPEKEKVKIERINAAGFNEKKIIIFETILLKDKHINRFLENLNIHLNSEQKKLLIQQENRLDEELNFFIRLDKEKLLNNQYWIVDHGNCFHIRINIAAFPRTKGAALTVTSNIFKE